jgi:hypothetical protein
MFAALAEAQIKANASKFVKFIWFPTTTFANDSIQALCPIHRIIILGDDSNSHIQVCLALL